MAKEEQGEPGLESVNWNDEQDPDNPALLRGVRVVPGGIRCTMRTPKICHTGKSYAVSVIHLNKILLLLILKAVATPMP